MSENIDRNRMTLLLIAGIPVIIILASSWLWYYVASGRLDLVGAIGTANMGELLDPPVAIAELHAVDAAGRPFEAAGDRPLWRIVLLGGEDCGDPCRHLLYYTRQIHVAMGKYTNRIERVYLAAGTQPGDRPLGGLGEDYPELKVLYTSAPAAEALGRGAGDGTAPAYFVMDPNGWIILSYTADADGKDIMADLKFLLKNSN